MTKRQALAAVLGLALALTGCDDGFLETIPPDQVSDVNFWGQPKDAEMATNVVYRGLLGQNLLYLDGGTDNAFVAKYFVGDGIQFIGNGTHTPTTGWISTIWNGHYTHISYANELLERIDEIPSLEPALNARYKAEARFLRAYYYTNLVNLYGDVPLVLKTLTIDEGKTVARAPAKDVVDQIMADLDYAAGILPNSWPAAQRGRATKGAALALKARAALYAGRYDVAATAAKAVMDMNVYSLYPNYTNLFYNVGEGNAEVILDRQYIRDQASNSVFQAFAPRSLLGTNDVSPLRSLVDEYEMKDGLRITQSPLYDANNPYANRDPRFYGTIIHPGMTYAGRLFDSRPNSNTADAAKSGFDATATGFAMVKYVDPADQSSRTNTGLNIILLRYADVLLMYAEAKTELGQIDASVYDAINRVRARATMPPITTGKSQAQLRDIIRHERRIELALEGLRMFDIRRWRIAEQVLTGPTFGMDYVEGGVKKVVEVEPRRFNAARDYLWPIPVRETELNANIKQNPGY
jgi:starch-binding outer membrane protein, SusD/RagB family